METSRLMLFLYGRVKSREDQNVKNKNIPRFYKDSDEDEDGEIIFCKNNVCIFNGKPIPGYLTLKAHVINEYIRFTLHWTANDLLLESCVTEEELRETINATTKCTTKDDDDSAPCVFHIDLSEMKSLKFFFKGDETSGHFVVGNHENHYKVFHFDLGGMNHLVEIFENWSLCKAVKLPLEEQTRKKAFSIVPIYLISPNQSFEESRYCPMTKARWKTLLNKSGQLEDVPNFRKAVFFGGLFPEARQEVWPFLLHFYPFHSKALERKNIREKKMKEYLEINANRLNMPKPEYDKFWLKIQCIVDKDVVRTDRTHLYFAGSDNPNIEIMRNILLNYAYYQPEVGYSQGMSDLVASLLSTIQDEVDTFWCFVGLMEQSLLVTSPNDDSMDRQLLYLKELLRLMAAKFYAHLLLEDEDMDLLFCHRWLLLAFKREFHDLHVLRMWEACWSHYQTKYFHIFIAVAIVLEYGDPVWQRSMRVDEILNFFNNLAFEMDGNVVLKKARSLLYQFRKLAEIPCTLRGLLSGPGAWDSATLPNIECSCHDSQSCVYANPPTRVKNVDQNGDVGNNEQAETWRSSLESPCNTESCTENYTKLNTEDGFMNERGNSPEYSDVDTDISNSNCLDERDESVVNNEEKCIEDTITSENEEIVKDEISSIH